MLTKSRVLLYVVGAIIGFGVGTIILKEKVEPTTTIEIPAVPLETYRENSNVKYSKSFLIRYTEQDVQCLQANIFHEARNQSITGRLAVATVTVNRYTSKRFPNTICGVVTQGKKANGLPIKGECAFSWYCDGKGDRPNLKNPITYNAWVDAENLAKQVLSGRVALLGNATHYHTTAVKPWWHNAPSMKKLSVIGSHVMYIETPTS